MKTKSFFSTLILGYAGALLWLAVLSSTFAGAADLPPSLIPPLGTEGADFSVKAQNGHTIRGWLPTGWVDNSEWAPITATYEAISDRPDDALGAVRIKLEKMEDGQLQLTSYDGERVYEAGKTYRIFGWARSPESRNLSVYVRQSAEPYEAYHEAEVACAKTWKPFEFTFRPAASIKALVMFAVRETGTVDLAGLTVAEGGVAPGLLAPFGTEGAEFSHPAAQGHVIQGWLPTDWVDNSEWGPVTATYSRIEDAPAGTLAATRIAVEKLQEGQGLLQLTTYSGPESYHPGHSYQVTGWIRSAAKVPVTLGARQTEEPYAFYHETELETGAEWKPFTFTFQPAKEIKAMIMFVIKQTGAVDLAGVSLTEQAAGK
jgi:hypothetical protein